MSTAEPAAGAMDILPTRDGYDRWAEIYDDEDNPLILLEEPRLGELLGNVNGLTIADIGCGTGRNALRLAGQGAQVTGVDYSEAMLKRARAKPGAEAVRFVYHDLATPLPFAAASFDRVLCCLVVDHVADLESFFHELKRICRPDGFMVVSVMHPAMMLRGIQARFTDPATGRETRPLSYPHQISDYVMAVTRAGLVFDHLSEHAVDQRDAERSPRGRKYLGWPLLLLMRLFWACFTLAAWFGVSGSLLAQSKPIASGPPGLEAFRGEVQAILTGKCLTCHSPEKKKGKLELSRRSSALTGGKTGPAIVPGNPADSLLFQRLAAGEMPPQNPLSPEQVTAFKKWIETGAPYENEPLMPANRRAGPDWWSLQPVKRTALPSVRHPEWVRTPVDAFVLARLEDQRLLPSPEADRLTLLRRATFDLLGLPPTTEEVRSFVSDPDPEAYAKLIDRLLASPHYGERWARHWLDVVRFGESHGYEMNTLRPNAWPYRDYAIRAFNQDTPYPQFIIEQLAGDTLPGADFLTQSATGFLVGGAHDMVGNQTVDGMLQQRMDDLDDMITTTGATFLGLTVNCCRCHDHKFDPLSQRDYYSMHAFFAGVQHAEREIAIPEAEQKKRDAARIERDVAGIEQQLDQFERLAEPAGKQVRRPPVNPRRNVERFAPVDARFVKFTIAATNNNIEPCIDELEIYSAETLPRNLALTRAGAKSSASGTYPNSPIHRLEHLNDGRYGNSKSWISNEMGKGWVQIELPCVTKINRIVWSRDREERFKDRLATDYRIEVSTQPGAWRVVASSTDRLPFAADARVAESTGLTAEQQRERTNLLAQQKRLQDQLRECRAILPIYVGTFTQPGETHVLLRGDPMRKGETVSPAAPEVIRPSLALSKTAPERERRLTLARWLGQPENPLPAHVMVNRVWHYHFGQGIVSTPSDFGYNGDRPSHPELLDWLASEYIRSGWQLKPLHRLIMLSAAYRQSSRIDLQAMQVDRQNRLLWRMNPRRLEAECLRDAMLSVNGKLDLRMGGPGYSLWEKNTNYVVVFKPKLELGPDEFRRMIYQFKPRSQQDPTFGIFDCPDAALAKPRRTSSTTALQALNLLNSGFTVAQAEFFAERLQKENGSDASAAVDRAFQLALGREPTATEKAAATDLVSRHGLPAFCRAIYNASEFLYVD